MIQRAESDSLRCYQCGVALEYRKTEFEYMGFTFQYDLPHCPCCGQVHVPEELATGKMLKVEMELEEK